MLKLMEGMQALQNKCWMEGMTKELQKLFAIASTSSSCRMVFNARAYRLQRLDDTH